MAWRGRLQVAAVLASLTAYSLLSHYGNSHAQARNLATIMALAPMLALGVILVWRWQGALAVLLAAAAAAGALYLLWPRLTENFALLYLLQQLGFYFLMACTFAATLLKGRVPLCTLLADKVHGPLSPQELRYTRQVTVAWTLFFMTIVLATLLLYAFAPLRAWSLFVNFAIPLLLALMFATEYLVRRRVLPQVQSGGLMATLRVYFVKPG